MESILISIKKLLGITEEDTDFDIDIIIHINSVFMILHQLGVGPKNGFSITGPDETWDAYITAPENLAAVKSYVYLKVRIIFDPPQTSATIQAINDTIKELEWRLNVQVDPGQEIQNDRPTNEESNSEDELYIGEM